MVPESAQALGYLCFIMPEDMSRSLTQEDRFCLLLSRGQLTSDERARAREFLSGTVECSLLLDPAYAHQVFPAGLPQPAPTRVLRRTPRGANRAQRRVSGQRV